MKRRSRAISRVVPLSFPKPPAKHVPCPYCGDIVINYRELNEHLDLRHKDWQHKTINSLHKYAQEMNADTKVTSVEVGSKTKLKITAAKPSGIDIVKRRA